ncbi:MAG: hypothetical protein NVS2B7_21880 [Herpetosiphon sp.]
MNKQPVPASKPPITSAAIQTAMQVVLADLDNALTAPSQQLNNNVDRAELHLSELRDLLIAVLRASSLEPSADSWRDLLQTVNVALSLVVGAEYPASGQHRRLAEQARGLLAQAAALPRPAYPPTVGTPPGQG